jgi:heme exporter protein D
MIEWLAMGGYAWFVWGSYGVTVGVISLELVLVAARKRRALERALAESEADDGV